MWVISKRRLREFWEMHADAHEPLSVWHRIAEKASWRSLQEVRRVCPSADGIVIACPAGAAIAVTVFNIGGNKYRLITQIDFRKYRVFVKCVLTHAEYNKDKWKKQICRD